MAYFDHFDQNDSLRHFWPKSKISILIEIFDQKSQKPIKNRSTFQKSADRPAFENCPGCPDPLLSGHLLKINFNFRHSRPAKSRIDLASRPEASPALAERLGPKGQPTSPILKINYFQNFGKFSQQFFENFKFLKNLKIKHDIMLYPRPSPKN